MNFDKFKNEQPDPSVTERIDAAMNDADAGYLEGLASLPRSGGGHAGAWRVIGTVAAVLVAVVAVGAWLLIGLGLRNGKTQAGEADSEVQTYAVRVRQSGEIFEEDRAAMQGFFDDYVAEKACDLEVTYVYPDERPYAYMMQRRLTVDEYGVVHCHVDTAPTVDVAYTDKDFYHLKFVLGGGDEAGIYLYYTMPARLYDPSNVNETDETKQRGYEILDESDPRAYDTPFCEKMSLDIGFIENSAENGSRVFDYAKAETVVVENGEVVSGEKSLADFLWSYGRQQYAYAEIRYDGQLKKYRWTATGNRETEDGVTEVDTLRIEKPDPNSGVYEISNYYSDDITPFGRETLCVLNEKALIRLKPEGGISRAYVAIANVEKQTDDVYLLDLLRCKAELAGLEKAYLGATVGYGEAFRSDGALPHDYEISFSGVEGHGYWHLPEGGWVTSDSEHGTVRVKLSKEFEAYLEKLHDMALEGRFELKKIVEETPENTPEPEEPEKEDEQKPQEQTPPEPEPQEQEPDHEPTEQASASGLDPERLIPGSKLKLGQPELSTFNNPQADKTKTLTYARPDATFSFSADDASRNLAPHGTQLSYVNSERTSGRENYVLDCYADGNGNVYKYSQDGRLVWFMPNSVDLSRIEKYSPEFEKELWAHAREVALALYGDELNGYEEHSVERPSDSVNLENTSLFFGKKAANGTWINALEISVTCDNTVTVIAQPYDRSEYAELIPAELNEAEVCRLIGQRLKDDYGSATAKVENSCWIGDAFEYDGHVYVYLIPSVSMPDDDIPPEMRPIMYYYMLK